MPDQRSRVPMPPLGPLDSYEEVQHVLRYVRIMNRFFGEVVDSKDDLRQHYAELHCAYMEILDQELAPYALLLAQAVTGLEDAYPEITRQKETAS